MQPQESDVDRPPVTELRRSAAELLARHDWPDRHISTAADAEGARVMPETQDSATREGALPLDSDHNVAAVPAIAVGWDFGPDPDPVAAAAPDGTPGADSIDAPSPSPAAAAAHEAELVEADAAASLSAGVIVARYRLRRAERKSASATRARPTLARLLAKARLRHAGPGKDRVAATIWE
jgi:hypothetical protein